MYRHGFVVAGLLLAACAQAPAQQAGVQPEGTVSAQDLNAAVESIRPQDFFARIGFLASDALGGRDTPSPGLEAAAASNHVETIDLDKITRVSRLVFRLGHAIVNDTNAPQWDPAGLEEVRRLTSQGR